MCFSQEIGDTRTKCKFVFQQHCRCPTNQLEAIKFSKVISEQQNNGDGDQTCCCIWCVIAGVVLVVLLAVLLFSKSFAYGSGSTELFLIGAAIIVFVVVMVLCCIYAGEDGHSSLEVLYKCSACGKDVHRTYECIIDVTCNWSGGRHSDTFRYRNQTYSVWGQYTANVIKTVVRTRMTMNNFEAVERKFDVMSVVQTDNYYKTSDEWTNDLIRRLE
ncbi:hypothetical protein niasHS_009620 [Heterodera schachtii]|uniref:Uncharacterized protein n=1 Tax=Heterodera schachtii TaxID=97005 RepID=A0ABD2JEB0_HETSC